MKTLILMRHGNAKTTGASSDAARDLSDVGKGEAMDSGKYLLSINLLPDRIVCSHANRALQSARIIANIVGYDPKAIGIDKAIYYTDDEDVLEVIKNQKDIHNTVLMVGHNPTVSNIAHKFYPPLYQSLPPATIVVFKSGIEHWEDWGAGSTIEMMGLRAPMDGQL